MEKVDKGLRVILDLLESADRLKILEILAQSGLKEMLSMLLLWKK